MAVEFDNLLIAGGNKGMYSNAFIYEGHIIIAGHVAKPIHTEMVITVPGSGEQGTFHFKDLRPTRDLAISQGNIPTQGFFTVEEPKINQTVFVRGHHGPERKPFVIEATVVEVRQDGRAVIESQKEAFQLGMSGSPAQTEANAIVGVLVEEISGFKGRRVVLESAVPLLCYTQNR